MNKDVITLPDNMRELSELVKSHAKGNPEEELLGLLVGSCFDSDGEICDDLIDHMVDYIRSVPSASIDEIYSHLLEILPAAEYAEVEESA